MKLGLKQDEVKVVEYTPEWHEEFIRVKKELAEYAELDEKRIEHIGSTAIKGMSAKPILDIAVGIDDLNLVDKEFLKAFQKAGFLRLKVERPGEIVLAKFMDETYQVKTHFIHLVEFQKELWHKLIFFRDYLNADEAARTEYLEIKLAYLKNFSTGIKGYTDCKEAFVKGIYEKFE